MSLTQIRGNTQIKEGTIFDAQIAAAAAIATSKLADGAEFLKRDGSVVMTGNLDLNSHKIIGVAAPEDNNDAANKGYVDTALLDYVKHDGSVAMSGNLDLDGHSLVNVASVVAQEGASLILDTVDGADIMEFKIGGAQKMYLDNGTNNQLVLNDISILPFNAAVSDLGASSNDFNAVWTQYVTRFGAIRIHVQDDSDIVFGTSGAAAWYIKDQTNNNGDILPDSDNFSSIGSSSKRVKKLYVAEMDAFQLGGNLDANSNKMVNLAAPTSGSDAATKSYVDAVASGLSLKEACRAATTANISLSGEQTIDGVAVVAGDRVLVKNQDTASDNGIYVCSASAWSRASDLNEQSELKAGIFTFVTEGNANADSGFILVSDNPLTLGSSNLQFTLFSNAGSIAAGAGLTKSGNTINVVSANAGIVVNADNIELTLADASLEIVAGGLRVKAGTEGQVLVANASGVMQPATLSGDIASVSGAGVVALSSDVLKKASLVTREAPSGSINGTNDAFTLAHTPVVGSEQLFLNGLLLEPGSGNDYTISGANVTMLTIPQSGDRLRAVYLK